MSTMTASFTAVGNGKSIVVENGETFSYVVTGTFVGTWVLQRSEDLTSWFSVATGTSTQTKTILQAPNTSARHLFYRFRCSVYTSGTISASLSNIGAEIETEVDSDGTKIVELNEDALVFHKDSQCESSGMGSVPTAVSSTCEVIHYGCGPFIKSVFTLTSFPVTVTTVTTGNGVGGTKFFDFPEGYIRHFGTTASLAIAVTDQGDYTDATPEGDVGIGTVAPANADSLGTDATDDDFGTAAAFTMDTYAATVTIAPESAANFDGTSTAKDLYLNALVDAADMDDDASDNLLFTGTITVCWMNLGDY